MFKTIPIDGHTIEYFHIQPTGIVSKLKSLFRKTPVIIFLHGVNDPVQNHTDFYVSLAKAGYEVFAPNMPGHGNTQHNSIITWEGLVDIVCKFSKQLDISEVFLIGYSMGATIAMQIINDKKLKVTRASLVAPFNWYMKIFTVEEMVGIVQFFLNIDAHRKLMKIPKDFPIIGDLPYLVRRYTNLLRDKYPIDLSNNDIPIKIFAFELDEVIKLDTVQELHKHIKNSQLYTLKDMTHEIYYLNPDKIDQISHLLIS